MASLTRDLVVNILADTSKLNNGIDQANKKMTAWGKAAKITGGALAAGFAADKVLDFLGDSVAAAEEHNKVMAQTEAVIKSMGNAAGVTADEVDDLATSIERKTGIDGDAIQTGQNLLLTFGNIKNAAGEGNDIFDQTTKIMVDMAAAMGTDASASAIQLGKALNDPITGITALTRVGVSFTEQQKEQIKAMAEAGDVAGAQKLILAELEKQFGGSAEAQATATGLMSARFKELQEEIGQRLVPVIEGLATFILDDLIPAFETVWPVVKRVFDVVTKHIEAAFHLVMLVVEPVIHLLKGEWGEAWDSFKEHAVGAFQPIIDAVTGAFDIITDLAGELVKGVREAVNKIVEFFLSIPKRIAGLGGKILGEITAGAGGLVGKALDFIGLAEGGIVTRPTLAIVGESGPEAVVPLRNGVMTDRRGISPLGTMTAASGGGGQTFNIGTVIVQASNVEQLVAQLNDYARRNGGWRMPGGVTAVS